jgi:cytochrome P450
VLQGRRQGDAVLSRLVLGRAVPKIMGNYRANGKKVTPDETVQNIFIVMFASMHGTSFVGLQSLFGILGTPGALDEIREEARSVMKNELDDSPDWTRHPLGELRVLDSFMKETLRMKPFQEGNWPLYFVFLIPSPSPQPRPFSVF